MYCLDLYQPKKVMRYFEDVSRIPRESGNEAEICNFVVNFANERGLEVYRDEIGNVLIKKPGSKGCEDLPPLLIQGHLDMVCKKTKDSNHDFLKDPIKFRIEGDYLYGDGTTLGADNAVAIANMLALADSTDLVHPPLELLFTVQEEIGLWGIKAFDMSRLKSRRMINMDCGDADTMCIGSAGRIKVNITRECKRVAGSGLAFTLKVSGLTGGHSGVQIDKGRASAINLLARVLYRIMERMKLNLVTIQSEFGSVIPKFAECLFCVSKDNADAAADIVNKVYKEAAREYKATDPDLTFELTKADSAESMVDDASTTDIIRLLYLLPYGVMRVEPTNGQLICSCNTEGIAIEGSTITIPFSSRSTEENISSEYIRKVRLLAEMCGAECKISETIPAWPVREDSALQAMCKRVFCQLFGEQLKTEVMHAGVETSFILQQIPDMDIIGIAPTATGAHTVEEKLYLPSMKTVWYFLVKLLAEMCVK